MTDAGGLEIVGPAPLAQEWTGQERTCVAGQTCRVHGLQGYFLTGEDKWSLLDTCGVRFAEPHASPANLWPGDTLGPPEDASALRLAARKLVPNLSVRDRGRSQRS